MALEEYRARRDPARTPEPAGAATTVPGRSFVVQKHAARRLHYDFRLEWGGVLKSWAVTKGPSLDPADKRLAVHVEDHPVEYGGFEGVIPKGEYGGGTVMLWDRGAWEPEGDPDTGHAAGHLKFRLDGERLKGGWALVRMTGEGGRNWLLIKERDEFARPGQGGPDDALPSVASGRSMVEIAEAPDLVWHSEAFGDGLDPAGVAGAVRAALASRLAPMLASAAPEAPAGPLWLHEIKFDGYRLLTRLDGGAARLFTRTGLDWTDRFPAIAAACAALPAGSAWLDGEVVALDTHGVSRFHDLQRALSEGRDGGLVYQLFDLVALDGWDLAPVPLEERKRLLAALLAKAHDPRLRYTDHLDGQGPEFRAQACAFALEGVVSKRRDRPYRPGRGHDWVKVKCANRQEFVVVGFTRPQGARTGIGALLLAVHDPSGALVPAGRVGTGFSAADAADLEQRLGPLARADPPFAPPPARRDAGVTWVEPRLVVEVQFAEWTADGQLRQPSYQGLRADRDPADIVREAGTVNRMHEGDAEDRLAHFHLTHPDRVLFPEQGLTKRALAALYLEIAGWMLPHLAGRPLTLLRCPEGRDKDCFYQRHPPPGLTKAVRQVPFGDEVLIAVEDVAGLVGLVQAGALEIHTWGSRLPDIGRPDLLVMDLDPDPDLPWRRVQEMALILRERLSGLGLTSFAKTTGGKGLHVVVPISPGPTWERAKEFTRRLAEATAAAHPDRAVANMAKARRTGRIFIDYLRNQQGATFIAPYSTRARLGAPVAVPLSWAEVESGLRSDHFTADTVLRRLANLSADPWAGMAGLRQSLPEEDP